MVYMVPWITCFHYEKTSMEFPTNYITGKLFSSLKTVVYCKFESIYFQNFIIDKSITGEESCLLLDCECRC